MYGRERFLSSLVLILAVLALVQAFVILWLFGQKLPSAQTVARENNPTAVSIAPDEATPTLPNATSLSVAVDVPTRVPTPTPMVNSGRVGERIVSGRGYALTLNQVQESQGTDSFKPRAGDILLLLNLTAENSASNELVAFNSSYFFLGDASGAEHTSDLSVAAPQLATILPTGRSAQGWLTFELPADAQGLILTYRSNSFSSPSEIQIDLGR